MNMNKRYLIKTYGCQMNVRDSETLCGFLSEMGYSPAENEKDADIIVYNTCCVRENAENRFFGNLGYAKNLKQTKKDLKVVVCGCMTQQDAIITKIREQYSQADVVFGTFNIHKFPELLLKHFETGEQVIDIYDRHTDETADVAPVRGVPFKASVNVMYGCDNFCSYCVVPFVRGRERSVPVGVVLEEVKQAVDTGAKEILLLGQNVNSYGIKEGFDTDFASLLRLVADIQGVERVRFTTSHPKDLSPALIDALNIPNVCKHLHLPVQSGSDNVLTKMNRKYTRRHYLSLVEALRKTVKDISITTDIIVGFPAETEDDFNETLSLVEKARFDSAFMFYYSPRGNTPAAVMDGQISQDVQRERFDRLNALVDSIVLEKNKEKEGRAFTVLCDNFDAGSNIVSGRTDGNGLVHFTGFASDVGEFRRVRITDGKPYYLLGELC